MFGVEWLNNNNVKLSQLFKSFKSKLRGSAGRYVDVAVHSSGDLGSQLHLWTEFLAKPDTAAQMYLNEHHLHFVFSQ